MTAATLCKAIRRAGHPDAVHFSSFDAIVNHLLRIAQPTDVILTQGAGSVWKVGEAFLKADSGEKRDDRE